MVYLQYLNRFECNVEIIEERGDAFEELYDDDDFQIQFCLRKDTVIFFSNLIYDRLEFLTRRNDPISPRNHLLTALCFYATGSFHSVIGDVSDMPMHKSTVGRIILQVSSAIASLSHQFIKFPTTQRDQRDVTEDFYKLAGFPGVFGALDCSHVWIQSPGGENGDTTGHTLLQGMLWRDNMV